MVEITIKHRFKKCGFTEQETEEQGLEQVTLNIKLKCTCQRGLSEEVTALKIEQLEFEEFLKDDAVCGELSDTDIMLLAGDLNARSEDECYPDNREPTPARQHLKAAHAAHRSVCLKINV